ncbi:DNA cytosine methyltransferase [Ruminococcus callidus]|jgi:DNA (cytosine-5)-methyltransferase 1|uniref:DNA cytosine methyltransferase n=1 Tax=Ruminococcus callidus TaxID=40519 RepID=UPI00266D0F8D|nr:DNA cytosine methyltransferase [uncultured Ruminococcus sp.]
MNKPLTLGSLFDGSGTFPMMAMLSGIVPVWKSEIEPFPIAVTEKRLPFVKHLGDINSVNGAEIEPVDIITFGSPCTDLSVAGKRQGLNAERSGLFFQAIRIIKEMRGATNGKYPRFAVWENVTGAFSSNGGEDFRCVLEEFCKIKDADLSVPKPEKWTKAGEIMGENFSVAYRTFDAQYWGVPQRRMRVYLVADFEGGCASKILFESEGMSGYSAESFRAWQETAQSFGNCSEETGSGLMFENHSQDTRYTGPLNVAQTVSATYGTGGNNQPFVVESSVVPATLKIRCGHGNSGRGALIQKNKSATLSCNNDQTLFVPKAYGICGKYSNSMLSNNPNSGFYEADTSRTIDTSNQSPCKNQGGMVVVEGNGSRPSHHGDGYKESETMYTLNCVETHAISYGIGRPAMNQGYNARFSFQVEEEKSPTIVASGAGGIAHPKYSTSKNSHHTVAEKEKANTLVASDYKDPPVVNDSTHEIEYIVRRLTPQECALLQGMPTWWCDDIGIENPTEEQINWWQNVFETYNKAVGKTCKPKSRKQIEKWLKNPYSDSAAYKMWGNGIASSNALFVLAGIAYYAQNEGK